MHEVSLQLEAGTAAACLFPALGRPTATAPGLIVVHEFWGLNDSIKALSARFAEAGYDTLAVDLYAGQVTSDAKQALRLAIEMQTLRSTAIIESGARWLKARADTPIGVGATGFCLGGAMALAAACHCPSVSAFVPFYGFPVAKYLDASKVFGPILGHYAREDRIVDLQKVNAFAEAVQQAGGQFELHVYDASHAFMRVEDPKVFDAAAADLAWSRTMEFLGRHIGGGARAAAGGQVS